jgi:hypothetical protein
MGYFHNADKYHVLDADNKPRLTGDRAEWERFRDSGRSLVARDIIGNVEIRTEFVVLANNRNSFRTVVVGGVNDGLVKYHLTYTAAKTGHELVSYLCGEGVVVP